MLYSFSSAMQINDSGNWIFIRALWHRIRSWTIIYLKSYVPSGSCPVGLGPADEEDGGAKPAVSSAPLPPPSLFRCSSCNRSLFLHFALRFWNHTWKIESFDPLVIRITYFTFCIAISNSEVTNWTIENRYRVFLLLPRTVITFLFEH